jgi:hypothetical protein
LALKPAPPKDAGRHDLHSCDRNDFVTFAPLTRRLGIAAHAEDESGDCLFCFRDGVLHRRFVLTQHGDAGSVGDDLDLKLFMLGVVMIAVIQTGRRSYFE